MSFQQSKLFCAGALVFITLFKDLRLLVLTADTDSWSAVKRQISPAWPESIPPFRHEFFSIRPENFCISMHGVNIIHYKISFFDKKW
jgi:hypothetical protein